MIEIADGSLAFDLQPKLTAYADAGIAQNVVVDLVDNRVLNHEQPAGSAYARATTLVKGDTIQVSAGTDGHLAIPVDLLLP